MGSAGQNGTHSQARAKGPGVVIGRSGASIGRVHFSAVDYWPHNTCLYVTDFQGNHPRFAYYLLQTLDLADFNSGSAQPSLNRNYIYGMKVRVPIRDEQNKIVEVLQALDDRIVLLRQTNATLESLAQALFKSWFIDFDPVRAKAEGREPEGMNAATAALFPAEFDESALGLIPKGWTHCPAEQLFDVGIGKTPPRKEPQWFSEGSGDLRWLSIKDMGDEGPIASRTSEFLSAEAVAKFKIRIVPSHTVLLSFKLTVGRLSITDGPMCTNEAIAHFKARGDSPPFTYLYCYLKAFDFRTLGSTSSIADATNSKAVKALPVLVPSEELVAKFHDAVDELFQKMYVQKAHWRDLEELRDTLLPRLISGRLRLYEAQSQLEEAIA
jgi:type I restriction enzyme S subunit